MNYLIVGAGAIGCYVGARLIAAGQRVALVGRAPILDPLAKGGLTVSDLDGFWTHLEPAQLQLFTNVAQAWQDFPAACGQGTPTVILLCVKGGATASAAQEIAAHCPPGTLVVSLQNGVDNLARIAQAGPGLQAVAGMVPYNVVMPDPHKVHRATEGALQLAKTPVTRTIAQAFNASGLPTVLASDMLAVQWGKLLLNLNNPVNALSDLPLVDQLSDRDMRCVLAALQTEALQVLGAAGIRPAKISKVPARFLPFVLGLPNWLFSRVAANMLRMDARARSSMWEDVQRGRVTEIDDLCGAVVRLAAQHGVSAPRNAAMCTLMASCRSGQHWSGNALRQAVG
ncbi:MAG: 2-dehydropantoate 2-reductase [Betaproteobacteria bacterium]